MTSCSLTRLRCCDCLRRPCARLQNLSLRIAHSALNCSLARLRLLRCCDCLRCLCSRLLNLRVSIAHSA
eukprot:5773367-Pleurochrysis_carterae.AAC.1